MALLDFMKRYHPEDSENINMISVGFGMYRDAADHLAAQGRKEVERVKHDLKSGLFMFFYKVSFIVFIWRLEVGADFYVKFIIKAEVLWPH